MTANIEATKIITGLDAGTNYNLYFVPINTAGGTGEMKFVAFTTVATSGTTGATTGTATTGGTPP